ncbi:MAG: TIGR03986 family CRISPR-associated RAMP protein [Epsilonproteobacteria bacterium]|nr:TIGR03986 family CRISPR-associated RAMP protein [Campylobacterota bacterium]
MITAPYNFVPLNKEVFYPSWAEDVSHDTPFADGESGEIDITITAKSPIFIRNHSNDKESPSSDFCNHNGQYYIPGSTIKGVIRTITEIISFSKLKLQDKTLSYRDLNNPSYKQKAMDGEKIYMGWLQKQGNSWSIENLGKVTNGQTRIKYDEMSNYLSREVVSNIKRQKEAYKKYEQTSFDALKIDKGTIVFTGSTGNKTREFLFPNHDPIKVFTFDQDSELAKTFTEAYYIGTPNESKDWKNLWSQKFKNGNKIPVFFQLKDDGTLKHFGLSMLYKLPYENSLQEILEKYQNFSSAKDLSELLYGYVDEKNVLKGRVQFSHLKCVKSEKYNKKISLPLSTPRATFYPNYLVQCCENGKTKKFITYDRKDAILRGFKMYPPKQKIQESAKDENGEDFCKKNPKLCSSFHPLGANSTFKGKIRFHNLKALELGALLAALTFLNQNRDKKYFHKLGMAKAYGFGTVHIQVESLNTSSKKSVTDFVNIFLSELNKILKIDLLKHPRIEAFFKLSSFDLDDQELQTMGIKGFVKAKKTENNFCLKEVVKEGYDKTKICKQTSASNVNTQKKSDTKVMNAKSLNDFFQNR